jgi:hypothetical protein
VLASKIESQEQARQARKPGESDLILLKSDFIEKGCAVSARLIRYMINEFLPPLASI